MSLSNISTNYTKSFSISQNSFKLNELRKKITKIFNEEFTEKFSEILILKEEEFFSELSNRVKLIFLNSLNATEKNIEDKGKEIENILLSLSNEKKTEYTKESNIIKENINFFFEKCIENKHNEKLSSNKRFQYIKSNTNIDSQINKKEDYSNLSISKIFEILLNERNESVFYFRKHCIFNKNHALHSCFEEQKIFLDKLRKVNDKFVDFDLENCNFFLLIYEIDNDKDNKRNSCYKNNNYKDINNKGNYTTRNIFSLNSCYSNFINNVRKSNSIFPNSNNLNNNNNTKTKTITEKSREIESLELNKIKYLVCLFCKKVYTNDSVLMYCDFCSLPFYTSLQKNQNEFIHPATWEKYHCGAIVNDQMRCIECKENLNFNTKSNKLICNNCNFISDPMKIKWKCIICNEDFKSNAKIYNPLEYKLIKQSIKNSLLNKIPILPHEIDCCLEIREKIIKSSLIFQNETISDNNNKVTNMKFYMKHKKECEGDLYEGLLYNRKIVVCSECQTFVNYEKFIWYCHFCNKKFKKKNLISNNIVNEINNNYSTLKKKEKNEVTKDILNLDLSKKINSDGKLKNTKNFAIEYNDPIYNESSEEHKNQNLNRPKINENLLLNKKDSFILNKNNKIIEIPNNEKIDSDKPLLNKINKRFKEEINLTSNISNFISKAMQMNKSLLMKKSNQNKNNILNFSINNFKKDPFNFSKLDFNTNNSSIKNDISLSKDTSKSKEKIRNVEVHEDYFFHSSNNSNSNDASSKNTIATNKDKNKNKMRVISLNELKEKQNNLNRNENDLKKSNGNFIGEENKEINKQNEKLSISFFNNKTEEINNDQNTNNDNTIKSKFKNKTNNTNENNKYEVVKDDINMNENYIEINLNNNLNELNNHNEYVNIENIDIFNFNKKIKKYKPNIDISLDSNDNFIDENIPKFTITPCAKNSKSHFRSIFKSKEIKRIDLNQNINIEYQDKIQNENKNSSNNSTFIYNRNSIYLKKENGNTKENHFFKISPQRNQNDKTIKKINRINNRIYINKNSYNLDDTDKSNIQKETNTINDLYKSELLEDNIYVKPNVRFNYNKISHPNRLNFRNEKIKLNISQCQSPLENRGIFLNLNENAINNFKEEYHTENFTIDILFEKEKKLSKNSNEFSPNSKTYENIRKLSNENCKKIDFNSKIKRYGSNNSNNNINDISTSSISHHNKYINSYLSKKNSDNEIVSNLNFNSNNIINTDCNYSYLNNNNFTSEENSNNYNKQNVMRIKSMILKKNLFIQNEKSRDSNKDIPSFKGNENESKIYKILDNYFSFDNQENTAINPLDLNIKSKSRNNIKEDHNENNSKTYENLIYRKKNSMSISNMFIRKNSTFNLNNENYSNNNNESNNNIIKISNIKNDNNENIFNEHYESSDKISSSKSISNNNNINSKDSNSFVSDLKKNNLFNSVDNLNKNNSSYNVKLNFIVNNINNNNKENSIINEIINEELLEFDYSNSIGKLRKSLNYNSNKINDKINKSFKKETIINNEYILDSPDNYEISKQSQKQENENQIEIIFSPEKFEERNMNLEANKINDLNQKFRNIKINCPENSEFKEQNFNPLILSNFLNEELDFSKRKSMLRNSLKIKSDIINSDFSLNNDNEFSNFTYKALNNESNKNNLMNEENIDKRKSNKKVDFNEEDIVIYNKTPKNQSINLDIINYNSPSPRKNINVNEIENIKDSVKSPSQISIVNTSHNNIILDENNIFSLIEDFTFDLDDYIMEKAIGEGTFASVYSAYNKYNFKKYAIKKLIVDDISHINNIISEIKILNKFKHENIVQIHGMFFKKLDETTYALFILMELASIDWDKHIKDRQINKSLYTEVELVDILKQIVSCLSFLQENNISHRDIKPHNLLIFNSLSNSSKNTNRYFSLIKISDFGEARITQANNTNKLYTIKGTELFMSPKLIECYQNIEKEVKHNPYKSDCFSLGLCLLYAASLNINSVHDIRFEIQENYKITNTINKYLKLKFTKKFIELLTRMLELDENSRFDFLQLNEFLKRY